MKRIILALICLILSFGQAQALKVFLVSNHNNAGDHNHTLGVAKFLSGKITDIDTSQTTPENVKEQVANALNQDKVIVIGSGEGGVQGIQQLSPNPNLVIALSSHMYLPSYSKDVLNKVNFIALPSHVSESEKSKLGSKLLAVTGLPHNRDAKVVEQTFNEWKKDLPSCSKYIGVVLGGDAPSPSNDMRLFTTEDAEKLAGYIIKHIGSECVLVLNGPRTGKHNAQKNVIPTAHKDGKLDQVTKHFVSLLSAKINPKKLKVFDFQFNNKPPYNTFDLAVGAVNATHGFMYVPGDSTSMISEAIDTIEPGHVIVYTNSAMNDTHEAHVKSELEANRALVLENYNDLKSNVGSESTHSPSAAEAIAKRLMEEINI